MLLGPLAGSSEAAVTTTNVTTPAGPELFRHSDTSNGADPQITISGTAPGAGGGDLVDIRCYRHDSSGALQKNDIVNNVSAATGSFNYTGSDDPLRNSRCLLRAVPAGSTPTDLGPFTGPTVFTAETSVNTVAAGPNAGKRWDFFVGAPESTAYNDLDSFGSCSLCDTRLFSGPEQRNSEYLWYYNAAPSGESLGNPYPPLPQDGATGMRVDGNWGYDAYHAHNNDTGQNGAGFPSLDVSMTISPTNAFTVTETQNLVNCTTSLTTYPPPPGSPNPDCNSWGSTGVKLVRRYTSAANGREILIDDRWSSTNGAGHTVDLVYWQATNMNNVAADNAAGFTFPWIGASAVLPSSSQVFANSPAAPFSYFAHRADAPDGSLKYPTGAVVEDSKTSDLRASNATLPQHPENLLELRTINVPASGETRMRFAYVMSEAKANVDAGVAKYINLFNPPAPADTTPSVLSALKVKPAAFAALGKGPSIIAKRKVRGSRVSYQLSEDSTVTFTVDRARKGRKKKGKKCSPRTKRGKRCTTYKKVKGSFTHTGRNGANSFRFSGRISGKKLRPGNYRLVALPTDKAGNRGKTVRKQFRIKR
jgi:hypothetical protein